MFNIASEAPDGFDIRSRIRSNNEPSEFEPRNNTFINATTLINAVAAMQSSSPPSSLFNENAPEAPHSGDIGPSSPSLSEIQNLRLFSPPASPELFSNNYTKPPSTIATNLDSTCLSCGDVFDDQSQLHTCSTPSCTRSFCIRCIRKSSSKGAAILNSNNICAICDYQSVKRPTLAPHEWHWTFNDHADLEFTRSLRDSLPAVPGLFLEIHGMRQACWRRRIGGVRKHYSFKQHGGFFEGRLQALQVSMTMVTAQASQRLMLTMMPGGGLELLNTARLGKSPLIGYARGSPGGFAFGNRFGPPAFAIPPAVTADGGRSSTDSFTDSPGSIKRKQSGGILPPFPTSKRRSSIMDSEGRFAWCNSEGHFMQEQSKSDGYGKTNFRDEMKKEDETTSSSSHQIWNNTEGQSVGVAASGDEPRCAICCEFVTKRSTYVCTCQIHSCSRVLCLHCVQEGMLQGVNHFNGSTGYCAICQYQENCVQAGQSTRPPEAWHVDFDPQIDGQFLREYTQALPSIPSVWFDPTFIAWRTDRETFTVPLYGGLFEARWTAIQSQQQETSTIEPANCSLVI